MSISRTRSRHPRSDGSRAVAPPSWTPADDDDLAEVYPRRFTSRYRGFRIHDGPTDVQVDVWSHNLASWVTLRGSLAPRARGRLTRLLAEECGRQRSITIDTSALDQEKVGDLLAPVALTLTAVGLPVHLTDAREAEGTR